MNKRLTIISIFLVFLLGFYYWWQNRIINKITISVVIPIYNAEKYLAKCLDSVFIQSGPFEVIAVNDGSTDNSLNILKQYAAKHSNMKIIDQQNQGIASARNAGIRAAKNKYITFIDNDDWWEKNAFSTIRKVLKKDKPDVLISNFYDVYDKQWVKDTRGEKAAQEVPEESKYPKRDLEKLALFSPFYAKNAISDLYYEGGTWVIHSFYKKEFLTKYNLEFPDKISIGEDLIFMFRVYAHNPFISVLNKPLYNYYNRVDSASKGLKTLNVLLSRIEYLHQTAEYQNSPRYIQMYMDDNFISTIFVCIANLQRHGIPLSEEIDKIYNIYAVMFKYNQQELKSAHKYQSLKKYLQQTEFNLPL